MSFSFGDIVIVPFPFVKSSGETQQKARPAMVISDSEIERRYDDVILAAITSRIPEKLLDLELRLDPTDKTGLATESILRLDFLMTLPETIISRKIGSIPSTKVENVNQKLAKNFGNDLM